MANLIDFYLKWKVYDVHRYKGMFFLSWGNNFLS